MDDVYLQQGDLLEDCPVLALAEDFDPTDKDRENTVGIIYSDLIVISHTCDLLNDKLPNVAFCEVFTFERYLELNAGFRKSEFANIQKGRYQGLTLLGKTEESKSANLQYVVDLRSIVSLPLAFAKRHALKQNPRYRLQSPFVEHLSQAFGRCYMRVALPEEIIDLP